MSLRNMRDSRLPYTSAARQQHEAKMNKHTPGPWAYIQDQAFPWRAHIMAGDSEVIATPMAYHFSTRDKTIADLIRRDPLNAAQMQNLRLMAASPRLLAACRMAADAFSRSKPHTAAQILGNLRSAIREATIIPESR